MKNSNNNNNNNIAELYSRIPDYSQVKHLGNSEFINTLEKLKEDFRQCRASLNEIDSDVEFITNQTNKILNISKGSADHCSKINNFKSVNITTNRTSIFSNNYLPATSNATINFEDNSQPKNSYLSIKSCSLHKNPNNTLASCFLKDRTSFEDHTGASRYESAYAEDYELCSDGSSTPPESFLSKWSSSPEIYTREKEFEPPSNIEKRLLERRSQNNSAPSIPDIDKKPVYFKAHPVPSHVHKPLYEYLMLKNKRRSMRVREASRQRLMAQVKPFSFVNTPKGKSAGTHGEVSERAEELLNNARPTKKRNNFRVKTNKFDHHGFRANPAPPRTKALLAAIKLKEQQEYRELKKKLRAEALMKSASLPPSMAARDRRTKANMTRLDELLCRFNSGSDSLGFMRRHIRESSSDTFTDDDRLTDEEFGTVGWRRRPTTSKVAPCSRKLKGNFTPYGQLRFPISSASEGIFETTSNDNHASRLRVQAAKAKEVNRMKQEEEELTRQMRMDKKRQELREAHLLAWRRAGSYSSSQDIAMRRQLRMATAILERENYRRDMSSMLNRVRSAPLLLEGVRERRPEPCKRHQQKESGRKSPNKLSSPRYVGQQYYNSKSHWSLGKDETEKSETAAMAEGSLTNSDNESVKNPDLEMDDQEEEQVEDIPHNDQNQNSKTPSDSQNQQYDDDNNDFEDDIDED